ncbi:MAG: hypothetical protein PHO62_07520 [Sulfurimonas sp.]|uniref:hypothetical protein n=1 Tax=Sulfurimonas sp. TaxID=2022749 RepID=UPI0026398E16|nr:hypothetical protein [Sulfurimonas sp.]MDD5373254.1 hypothetical protein [Sulfurimonas sp.]
MSQAYQKPIIIPSSKTVHNKIVAVLNLFNEYKKYVNLDSATSVEKRMIFKELCQ